MLGQDQRRESMRAQLNCLGMDWSFIDGVVGRDLVDDPFHYDAHRRRRLYCYPMSKGEIGCFMSHRKAWQACVELDRDCLILEDDVKFLEGFLKSVHIALGLRADWDLFRFHSGHYKKFLVHQKFDDVSVIENLTDTGSSAAYMVSPYAAKELLKYSDRFSEAIDDFLEQRYKHGLRNLAFHPYPVIAGVGDSSIQDRVRPRIAIKQRVLRELYRIPLGWAKFTWRCRRKFLYFLSR